MANIGATAVLKATFDSKDFDQGMHRAQKRTKDFENQTKKAQGQLRLMRGGLGQLGHQVQDVAVQLQAGQNGLLVFGQQGSQIASLMGPNGAVIGAVLAVGAAIGTALLPKLFGATEAMRQLKESTNGLRDRYDELTTAQKAFVESQVNKEIHENNELILEKGNKLFNLRKELASAEAAEKRAADGTRTMQEAMKDYVQTSTFVMGAQKIHRKSSEELKEEIKVLKAEQDTLIENNGNLQLIVDKTTTAFEKQTKSLDMQIAMVGATAHQQRVLGIEADVTAKKITDDEAKILIAKSKTLAADQKIEEQRKKQEQERIKIANQHEKNLDRYELEIESIGKTKDQIELLKLEHAGYTEKQIQEIENLKQLKEAREQAYQSQVEQEAQDMGLSGAFTAVKDEFSDMDAAMQQAMLSNTSTVLGSVSQTMDAVGQLFKEGSSEAKAFMLVSKGLEASNAIIAGLSGAVAIKAAYAKMALANPLMAGAYEAMGTASAAMMKTMGFVNAGMIMGQAVASFDGGGFTGHGARVAGVDGKGGFPAILHPNETVVDHTKGQPMATNVTINIQAHDTNGFDKLLRSRRGEIISIVNKAINNRGVSSLI